MLLSCPSLHASVRACVHLGVHHEKFVSTKSYKPVDRISLNFGYWCLEAKDELSRSWWSRGQGQGRHKVRYAKLCDPHISWTAWRITAKCERVVERIWCVDDIFVSLRSYNSRVKVRPRSCVCYRDNCRTGQGRPQADAQDARASTKLMDLEVCLSNCLT